MEILLDLYREALWMVSPGKDIPSLSSNSDDPELKRMKIAFRHAVKSLGSLLNWSFLLEKKSLSGTLDSYDPRPQNPSTATPPFDPLYAHRWGLEALPGLARIVGILEDADTFDADAGLRDFITRVRGIGRSNTGALVIPLFKSSARFIYTNSNPCTAVYVKKIKEEDGPTDDNGVSISDLPPYFTTALVWCMASYLTISSNSSLQAKAYFEKKYLHYKFLAQSADNNAYSEKREIPLGNVDFRFGNTPF